MANSGTVVINAVYNNSHGESVGRPGPQFTAGDNLFDYSKGCSPLTSQNNCIGNHSVLIRMRQQSFPFTFKELRAVLHVSKAVEQLLKKVRWIDL